MTRKIFFLFLLFCRTICLPAQDTTLSLENIFQIIEKTYPEILMYESKIKSIRERTSGAKSWMPPSFSFGLERFPYQLSNIGMKNDPMNQAGLMFSLEQMIPNSSKLNAKKNYFISLSAIQQNKAAWKKNQLFTYARLSYIRRYMAEKKLKIIKKNSGLLDLIIATAEEKYKFNQADLSTIYKAQAKSKELDNMQSMLNSEIAESNIALNTLMNRDVSTIFNIDTVIPLHNYETIISEDSSGNRNDIAALENLVQSMKLNQRWMESAKRPDFGIEARHMQMFGMSNEFSLMGMLTIPIVPWSAKMYKSEVKSMEFEIEAMQKEKETMTLMAKQMIHEKRVMLTYVKEQLVNYDTEIIPAYQKNMESSLISYSKNTGTFFVMLDAWDMLLMKQIEYLDILHKALILEAEYEFEIEKR